VSRILGRLLRPLRADANRSPLAARGFAAPSAISVVSPAFADGAPIPRRYAGKGVGNNISPPLQWTGVPPGAEHLALVMDDADVPLRSPLFHSIAVLEPDMTALPAGAWRTGTAAVRIVATPLGRRGYSGPRPIPGHGPQRYRFHVLALDTRVPDSVTNANGFLAATAGHVLARGTLTGCYER
jgi:phosphatidylethanolamine-binding protein (PEBP) family uncharacterized protein